MTDTSPRPTGIKLHSKSKELELIYGAEKSYSLSCEFLRVFSPSAEVKGHGAGQEVLQTGKANVSITEIKPVGNYALQLIFDDGHDTGLYSFAYLNELCMNHQRMWQSYLDKMKQAGANRDPDVQVIRLGL
ncbi:MAG: gamma-butyrobetaine hydroxylase-like domain-containing protein [Halioglobus sp.]